MTVVNAEVSVEREIAAPVDRVWALVTDVTRMGEWSPEAVSGRWLGGATGPGIGTRFKGANRNGWHRWSAVCEITDYEPQRLFTFRPQVAGSPYATWSYELEPRSPQACLVTESWSDERGWILRNVLGPIATGVRDRPSHNRATMTATLDRLAAAAETAPD